jgi:hypothetical protein
MSHVKIDTTTMVLFIAVLVAATIFSTCNADGKSLYATRHQVGILVPTYNLLWHVSKCLFWTDFYVQSWTYIPFFLCMSLFFLVDIWSFLHQSLKCIHHIYVCIINRFVVALLHGAYLSGGDGGCFPFLTCAYGISWCKDECRRTRPGSEPSCKVAPGVGGISVNYCCCTGPWWIQILSCVHSCWCTM